MEKFKVGDKVRIVEEPWKKPVWQYLDRSRKHFYALRKGKVYSVNKYIAGLFEKSNKPVDDAVSVGEAYYFPVDLIELVEPKKQKSEQCLSDEPHPEFKIGDMFRVVKKGFCVEVGDVAVLSENDGTRCPFFNIENGEPQVAISWKFLIPIVEDQNPGENLKSKSTKQITDVWFEEVKDFVRRQPTITYKKIVMGYCGEEKPATKYAYTQEQIQEAKEIAYRLLCNPGLGCCILTRLYEYGGCYDKKDEKNERRKHTLAILIKISFDGLRYQEEKRSVAFCSPNDEFNEDVGRMVALCKLLENPLPKWVKGEEK